MIQDRVDRGILYIISTPIGNPKDITLRAIEVLNKVNFVICEEIRRGSTFLNKIGVTDVECIELNEHNEQSATQEILDMLLEGKQAGLISDCGTPVFADPGSLLIRNSIANGIRIIPIPGASSLMAALSISPLPLKEFHFIGFLPRKTEERVKELKSLRNFNCPLILMDTPYRMNKLLEEVQDTLGKDRQITLAVDLTMQSENLFHGTVGDVREKVIGRKAEFILIIH